MIEYKHEQTKKITILITTIIVLGGVWYIQSNQPTSLSKENNRPDPAILPVSEVDYEYANDEPQVNQEQELMDLTIYVVTPEGIVEPVIVQVPKTVAVADASLSYLFNNSLSMYGDYNSVTITDGTAYISLVGNIPDGRTFSSLSSAEIFDLTQSIEMTLLQYSTISEVVLVDENENPIEF